ncbi:MAG TPA: hypothetical protein VNA13_01240 [Xanthomonadales bacterium]|nr:hypothetical protein [Xanthomonadales bacterium]
MTFIEGDPRIIAQIAPDRRKALAEASRVYHKLYIGAGFTTKEADKLARGITKYKGPLLASEASIRSAQKIALDKKPAPFIDSTDDPKPLPFRGLNDARGAGKRRLEDAGTVHILIRGGTGAEHISRPQMRPLYNPRGS